MTKELDAKSGLCFLLQSGQYLLLAAGALLLAWSLREGIIIPPVKRAVHPISILGFPAAIFCGLIAWTWSLTRRELELGRVGAAFGYFTLMPLGLALLIAGVSVLDWLGI